MKRGDVCYGMLRAAACVDESDPGHHAIEGRVREGIGGFHFTTNSGCSIYFNQTHPPLRHFMPVVGSNEYPFPLGYSEALQY